MMLFKHLITHYLWSRGYSHSELAKFLGVKEKDVLDWEEGKIPDPRMAFDIQKTLSYPKVKFWTVYFRTISRNLGENLEIELSDYSEYDQYIQTSQNHRKLIKHNTIPSDECSIMNLVSGSNYSLYDQNPQDLNTVLSLQLRLKFKRETKSSYYDEKDIKKLADNYEMTIESISKLLKDKTVPSMDELNSLVRRSGPGYDRDRMIKGYFSLLIKKFNLNLIIDDPDDQASIYQLERMAREKLLRKKKSKKS